MIAGFSGEEVAEEVGGGGVFAGCDYFRGVIRLDGDIRLHHILLWLRLCARWILVLSHWNTGGSYGQ